MKALIDELQRAHPDALQLAVLASPALRIEPALLRALRREVLRHADPSAELDLWFSDLVRARSPGGIAFEPEAAGLLRERFAQHPRREAAARVLRARHAGAHRLARLELELALRPLLDPALPAAELEALLAPLVDDLQAGGDTALQAARWLLQASPRWPARVRGAGPAWVALQAASALLGGRMLAGDGPPADLDPAWLALLGPGAGELRPLGVQLATGGVQFVAEGEPGAAAVQVPRHWPSLVVLQRGGGAPVVVSAEAGRRVALPGTGPVVLRLPDGRGWRLQARRRAGAAGAAPVHCTLTAWASEGTLHLRVERMQGPAREVVEGWAVARELLPPEAEAPGAERPWSWPEAPEFRRAVEALRDAQWIALDAAPNVAWLPWEELRTGFSEAGGPRPVGWRIVRRSKADRAAPHPSAAGEPVAALVLSDWGGERPPETLLKRDETLATLLHKRGTLEVHHVVSANAESSRQALFQRDWRVVHWSSRTAVYDRGRMPGVALDSGVFEAREFDALKRLPELVFLDMDDAGPGPTATNELSVPMLLRQLGVPVVIAVMGRPGQHRGRDFTGLFYESLLDGVPLHRAAIRAREAVRGAEVQVWGDPQHVLGIARRPPAPRRAPPWLLALTDLGEVMAPIPAVCAGPGVVLTVRAAFGQIPFLAAADGTQFAFDPPDGDSPLAVGLRVEGIGKARSLTPLPLPTEIAASHFAEAWFIDDGQPRMRLVFCETGPDGGPDGGLAVRPAGETDAFGPEMRGAILVDDQRLVGIVVELRSPTECEAQDVRAIGEALARSQQAYLRRRIEAHGQWLDSDGRAGRRLVADGAHLADVDLRKARLAQASLRGADLQRAALGGADLRRADLRRANLRFADLQGAALEGAQLQAALLEGARLEAPAPGSAT